MSNWRKILSWANAFIDKDNVTDCIGWIIKWYSPISKRTVYKGVFSAVNGVSITGTQSDANIDYVRSVCKNRVGINAMFHVYDNNRVDHIELIEPIQGFSTESSIKRSWANIVLSLEDCDGWIIEWKGEKGVLWYKGITEVLSYNDILGTPTVDNLEEARKLSRDPDSNKSPYSLGSNQDITRATLVERIGSI
jgi:hypothetical protein